MPSGSEVVRDAVQRLHASKLCHLRAGRLCYPIGTCIKCGLTGDGLVHRGISWRGELLSALMRAGVERRNC